MVISVARIQPITGMSVPAATTQGNQEVDMNKSVIQKLMEQAGTDASGKWMSVSNAEKFAQLVIEAYNEELRESRREVKSELGYSRIGLRNI